MATDKAEINVDDDDDDDGSGVFPPQIIEIQPSASIQASLGSPVRIYCNVIQQGSGSVSWLRNGQVIAYGPTLYLDNVAELDEGQFICKAENEAGFDEQSIYIYILAGW